MTCPIIVLMAAGQPCYISSCMAALYGLDWYKNRRRTNRKSTKKIAEEDYTTTKEEQQSIVEQLA